MTSTAFEKAHQKGHVNIIVVTYNHAAHIEECLKSLLAQETTIPFNIIIADDASTDGTSEIVRDYASKYPDVIIPIIQESNIGPGPNFSSALDIANAEYIAYCDGDDYWCHPKKIQIAIDALNQNPDCTIFVHNTRMIDSTRTPEKSSLIVKEGWKKNLTGNKFTLKKNQYTHISGRVYRNTQFPNLGDTFMYHYLLSRGDGYYHDEVMSVYRYNGNGAWSKLSQSRQNMENYKILYNLNKVLNFQYDDYYTSLIPSIRLRAYKYLFGQKAGWDRFISHIAGDDSNR